MQKHSRHFADRDRDSQIWKHDFFHFSSQTIQPCMFHYQMIKRPLVNIYVYDKHTNELGRIFKTTLTIFPDIASPF